MRMKRLERKVDIVVRRLRSGWPKIKQHRVIVTAVIVAFFALTIFIFAVYKFGWDWTGFNGGYGQVTTRTPTKDTVLPPAKTLWDWLQLLIIPLVLATGGLWFSQVQKDREQKAAEQRAQTEREAAGKRAQTERETAQDNQQEAALQEYINKMSDLLIDEELCKPTAKEETRKVARVRTLTVLSRLDGKRKGSVLQFLYEAQLINKGEKVVDLSGADLSGTDLRGVDLSGASLDKANLCGAILNDTILIDADLNEVNLSRASLVNTALSMASLFSADMRNADLRKASLEEANMYVAELEEANLSEAFLTRANLKSAKLKKAILFGANLSEADLSQAYLREINLVNANLSEANLKDAIQITNEMLEKQARSLKGATMPDGSIHS